MTQDASFVKLAKKTAKETKNDSSRMEISYRRQQGVPCLIGSKLDACRP